MRAWVCINKPIVQGKHWKIKPYFDLRTKLTNQSPFLFPHFPTYFCHIFVSKLKMKIFFGKRIDVLTFAYYNKHVLKSMEVNLGDATGRTNPQLDS